MKKTRKKKPVTAASLKKILWRDYFSPYIRLRYADPHTELVACVTCGIVKHWKRGDAGHFLPGRSSAILFDIRNVHFQCKPCNGGFRHQKLTKLDVADKYKEFMVKTYGQDVVDELKRLDKTTKQFTVPILREMIEFYKGELAILQAR